VRVIAALEWSGAARNAAKVSSADEQSEIFAEQQMRLVFVHLFQKPARRIMILFVVAMGKPTAMNVWRILKA